MIPDLRKTGTFELYKISSLDRDQVILGVKLPFFKKLDH